MKEIEQIPVREIQLCLLEMMIEIDRLCRQNHIPYFLDGGSALGAKRHQGFIPWDDDLDIGMMREDYLRFVKVLDEQLDSSKYFYHNFEKDQRYNVLLPAMKIRRKGSYILERNHMLPNRCDQEGEDSNGLFIDVFIYDYMSPSFWKDFPRRLFNTVLMPLMIFEDYYCHHNPLFLKKLFLYNAKKYGQKQKNSPYIAYDLTWTFRSPFRPYCFRYEDIFPLQELSFEGYPFLVAGKIENFLDVAIGKTWRELPPESSRIAKHTAEVRLPKER